MGVEGSLEMDSQWKGHSERTKKSGRKSWDHFGTLLASPILLGLSIHSVILSFQTRNVSKCGVMTRVGRSTNGTGVRRVVPSPPLSMI